MATPDFVLELRAKIGHHPLWLSGVTAVVLREHEGRRQVLLVRRADDGRWTPVTGIIDPGEQPAVAALREVAEEAGIVAVARRLAWVNTLPPMQYENGDHSQYLDLVFACEHVSGEPWPADGENTEAAYFDLDGLPQLDEGMARRIAHALRDEERAAFEL
ncbi:MAG: NUDIX domain-containing protein [Cellulomonas sp.]|nr:NUDIX domain-containing protein [Cellulomonas sp.]